MAEYRKCLICGCSYVGLGTSCPECDKSLKEHPVMTVSEASKNCVMDETLKCVECELCGNESEVR